MLRSIITILFSFAFACTAFAADEAALEKLQGKWETKKTSDEGQNTTQTIELKKDKLIFNILDSSGATVLTVTADVKLQKAGPFDTLTISNIKAGRDEDSLDPVEGDRSYVYRTGYQRLTIVSNLDEEREDPPALDVYKKVSSGK